MNSGKIIVTSVLIFCCTVASAQVPIVQPDLGKATMIAPAFFGPNAFQVPEMLDGTTSGSFSAEIAGAYYPGRIVENSKDNTWDVSLKLRIPLFSERVNLTIWAPLREWYDMDNSVMAARRIAKDVKNKGNEMGPAFISLDIQLLTETAKRPAVTLRSVLRTATEDKAFASARSYDCPGYFFDLSAGKGFGDFRVAASAGFLCWQTDNGRQNDAVMYGVAGYWRKECFSLEAQLGGYIGWEKLGDAPMTLRLRADIGKVTWNLRPFVQYQHGFNDWPFDQYRLGLVFDIYSWRDGSQGL